jgi:sulfur-oxidizing protein SoxY
MPAPLRTGWLPERLHDIERTPQAGFDPIAEATCFIDIHAHGQETMMHNRRQMLSRSARVAGMLAALGMLPGLARAQAAGYNTAAFEAKTMADVMKALGAKAPVESKDVTITGPDIAENGAVVPIGASTSLPGVKRVLLLVEKNPSTLSAVFDVSDAVEPNISTRVKMGQSSNVFAVAVMADGRVLYAAKEVKVTLGGCGG